MNRWISTTNRWLYTCVIIRNRKVFVNIDFILSIFSAKRSYAIRIYLKLMNDLHEGNDDEEYEEIKKFYPSVSFNYNNEKLDEKSRYRKSFDDILEESHMGIDDIEMFKSGLKKRHLTDIKIEFVKIAIGYKYIFKEIGEFMGVSQSAVSRLLLDKGLKRYMLK